MRHNVHTDPAFARAAGFPKPILQGVCTYGIVSAALVETLLADDASRVRQIFGSFTRHCVPW
jgi:acyl dehydratase